MTTRPLGRRRRWAAAVAGAAVLALLGGCSGAGVPGPSSATGSLAAAPSGPPGPSGGRATEAASASETPRASETAGASETAATGAATASAAVPAGEIVRFTVRRGGDALIDAGSSGVASYRVSPRCEVPGKPCYDAPTLDKVARMDVGAAPQAPGTQTTFVTGHSNRYSPGDPSRGVFSRLQDVRDGDVVDVQTTTGRFEYTVTKTLRVPFDLLPSTDDVVRVRPDTLVAISCEIAPDRRSYLGNAVVVASLTSATPA